MTACIAQLSFSFHKKRQVVTDFPGGHLTSDAGLLPLRELDHRLGWSEAAARLLTDGRDPAKVTHETTVLLRQRLFALVASCEDANGRNRERCCLTPQDHPRFLPAGRVGPQRSPTTSPVDPHSSARQRSDP